MQTRKSFARQSSGNILQEFNNLNIRESMKSQGRVSMYSSRPSLSHQIKDPRPIKDKKWQQQAIQKLIFHLVQSGFPAQISPKTLTTPSSKDFQLIFKFLYAQLDPHFIFTKKFEEEVPVLIKALRYPFADQINKSNLFTVGSLHAWPTLLAMLQWMVDLVLAVDQLDDKVEDEKELTEEEQADKMFFEYLTKAYDLWLKGAEDAEEVIEKALLENFEKKDGKVKKDLEKLNSEYAILEKEWTTLSQSEAPLTILEREKVILESDKEKFKNYISHMESKKSKLSETVKSLNQEFEISEENVKKLSAEREALSATVDSQELSPADVDRMNAERDQLAKSLAGMSKQLDIVTKDIWNEEIALQKKMDTLERNCDKFNTLLYKLDLLGSKDPKYDSVKQEIELFVQQSRPESMVSVSLRQKVKPALMAFIQSFKDLLFKVSDDTIVLQEEMDLLSWNLSKKDEEVQQVISNIKNLNERYAQEKEQIGNELTAAQEELEGMEKQIQQLKMDCSSIQTSSNHELKKITFECEQKTRKLITERDQLLGSVMKALTCVFSFEQHISGKLQEYDGYLKHFESTVQKALQE